MGFSGFVHVCMLLCVIWSIFVLGFFSMHAGWFQGFGGEFWRARLMLGVPCRSVPCSFLLQGCLAFQQQAVVAECYQPSLECCSEVQVVCIDRYFHYS